MRLFVEVMAILADLSDFDRFFETTTALPWACHGDTPEMPRGNTGFFQVFVWMTRPAYGLHPGQIIRRFFPGFCTD